MAAWSDEATEKLKADWAEGLSASKIAARIGTVTRNAVIGKAHRLGLSGRATTERKHPVQRRLNRKARTEAWSAKGVSGRVPPKPSIVAEMLPTDPPIPPNEYDVARIATAKLEDHHCKWPVGDPGTPGFGHCGCKREEGLPYCAEHVRRATSSPGTPREANTGWKPRTSGVMLRRMTSSVNLFEDA